MKTVIWFAALALSAAIAAAQDGSRVDERFKKLDANADGKVDKTEYAEANKDARNPDRRFKRIDADGDGTITLEEFRAAAKKAGEARRKQKAQ